MEAIETIREGNYLLEIFYNEFAQSPREWDNLGTMVCFHRRYNLGDKHNYSHEDFSDWYELKDVLFQQENAVVILPLYLYDHSGITINTTGFSCSWDSGQVGWVYVSKNKMLEEYNEITDETIEKAKSVIVGEIQTYDEYIRGEVYGYRLFKIELCNKGHEHKEEVDSCWGYYGMEDVEHEGNEVMKYHMSKEREVLQ